MSYKSRSLQGDSSGEIITQSFYVNNVKQPGDTIYTSKLVGFQEVSSDGHPVHLLGRTGRDIGGPFYSAKAEMTGNPARILTRSPGYISYSHDGPLYAWTYTKTLGKADLVPPVSQATLDAWGTTGIARADPTRPLSGMGQFFGELHELPRVPDIQNWKAITKNFLRGNASKRRIAKKGASDYLNYQFGWAPFVKDITDFARTTMHLTREAQRYARNSGRHVRRHNRVYSSTTTSVENLGSWYGDPAVPFNCVEAPGKLLKTTTYTVDVWFSGAFTYYLPVPDSQVNEWRYYEAQAQHLYGARPTPEVLWQLAPWSWAVDWVTNAGDVIHNLQSFALDGTILHYGYVMATQTRTQTWSGSGLRLKDGQVIATAQTQSAVTKQRAVATPYGFGLDWGSFTPRQLSIIAALGISRG